jgi:hypothetical protein
MLAKTIAETERRIHTRGDYVAYLHDYWGRSPGGAAAPEEELPTGPQAVLVDLPPKSIGQAHFHIVEQFQIFTEGTGYVGRHAVRPGTVQYTDEYTTYGPFTGGIRYMVVRAVNDPGSKYMPDERKQLTQPRGRARYYQVDMAPLESGAAIRELSDEPDGMAVCEMRMAPGQALPDVEGGAGDQGAYYAVLQGEINFGGQRYLKEACIYIGPNETLAASAGHEGAIVAFVRFPKMAKNKNARS